MTPDHPNHHSPGPKKDTQERPATIPSIPDSPSQSGKGKAMPSTVHILIISSYKTFQANPGMATLPTPKNTSTHQGYFPPTKSPTDKSPVYTIYLSSLRPDWHTPTLFSAHHATTPKRYISKSNDSFKSSFQ